MKKVYGARDLMEAHFVRCLLEREGIKAAVLGEMLGTARGELPLTQQTLPSVWVKPEDFERAMPLVDQYEAGYFADEAEDVPPPPEPWICPNCSEQIEGQFTHCWKCQTSCPDDDTLDSL
ncbi:MAG: DUF2007 domain-containing protein [Planctomycetota bacterium]|nr:MAG: DUF2007 domain-containing protein [Planctomycetota bacterium]